MPHTFEAFATHLRCTEADAVFILGDLFELWVGDDARHEPFARRCVLAIAEAAGRSTRPRTIAIMVGNRDFLMGEALLAECHAIALADPTVLEAFGERVLLTHGDELCIADTAYQAFRRQIRAPQWLAGFLARPLAERLAFAREIRRASETRRQFDGEGSADVDAGLAASWLDGAGAKVMVHGHTHRPDSETWASGHVRHVLSDWDLDGGATPAPNALPARAEVLRLTAAGFSRISPTPRH
jgi:UDP-2,3-diacylglucosamine hydrolase